MPSIPGAACRALALLPFRCGRVFVSFFMVKTLIILAAVSTVAVVVACSSSAISTRVMNSTLQPGTSSYAEDLRKIKETVEWMSSTVVIAGDTVPPSLAEFPEVKLTDSKNIEISNVLIRRIDSSFVEIFSRQRTSVSAMIPTTSVRTIKSTGERYVKPSWAWWLLALVPLLVTIGVALFATEWGANTEKGLNNGCLFTVGLVSIPIGLYVAAKNTGAMILEILQASWMFLQP